MARTVVEVFQDAPSASAAAAELLKEGFGRDDVCIVSGEREPGAWGVTGAAAGAAPEVTRLQVSPSLIADLVRLGVSEPDAIAYSRQVAGGAALVVARAEAGEATRATMILERARGAQTGLVQVPVEAAPEEGGITAEPEIREITIYSVIAVFDKPFTGESAIEDLVKAGLPRASMELISRDTRLDFARFRGALGLGAAAQPPLPEMDESESPRRFISEMGRLGVSEEDAKWYCSQADQQRYVLVAVTQDESLAERAAQIMEDRQQAAPGEAEPGARGRAPETPRVTAVRGAELPPSAEGEERFIAAEAFETRQQAERAQSALLDRGFRGGDVRLFSPGKADEAAAELARLGIPAEEAARHAARVREGSYVVVVRTGSRAAAYESAAILDGVRGVQPRTSAAMLLQEEAGRFGRELALSSRFGGRKWHEAAPEAERFWDERHPGTWQEAFASARRGYLSAGRPGAARPTHCVVASFVNAAEGQRAVDELIRQGFPRDRIRVATKDNAEAQLLELGLPAEAARRHAGEGGADGCLVAVLAKEDETARAARILRGREQPAAPGVHRHQEPGRSGVDAAAEQFGRETANAPEYRDRPWEQVEFDIRGFWEIKYPGTWERNREAIRRGFMQARESGYAGMPRTSFWRRLVHGRR